MKEPKRYSFFPQIVHLPGGGGIRAEVHFKVEEDGLFVAHQDYVAATQWRPIKTAPKDGTDVLLFEDGRQYVACWSETAGGQFFNDAEYQHNPTHWMPIPKPPQV